MTYYLGQAGALVALPDPETGLSMTTDRIGGTHQLLSGNRVRDTLGWMRTWQLAWTVLPRVNYMQLEGFYTGANGAGPYYFFEPEQVNILPSHVAAANDTSTSSFTNQTSTGLFLAGAPTATAWNSMGGPFPAGTSLAIGAGAANGLAAFSVLYQTVVVPVIAGLPYCSSVYISSDSGAPTIYSKIVWFDSTRSTISSTDAGTIAGGTAGRIVADNRTAPSNAVWALLQILTATANSSGSTKFVYADGFQLEQGLASSTWVPGYAVPLVTIDTLNRSTPLSAVADTQMTLVQVA